MRFNEAAQAFNTARNTLSHGRRSPACSAAFAEKAYFKAQAGAETAPQVQF